MVWRSTRGSGRSISSLVWAAHAGSARHAGGDDANIGTCDIGVVLRALERGVEAFGGAGLGDVERLAVGNALDDVEKDDVTEFLEGRLGGGAAPLLRLCQFLEGFAHGDLTDS